MSIECIGTSVRSRRLMSDAVEDLRGDEDTAVLRQAQAGDRLGLEGFERVRHQTVEEQPDPMGPLDPPPRLCVWQHVIPASGGDEGIGEACFFRGVGEIWKRTLRSREVVLLRPAIQVMKVLRG